MKNGMISRYAWKKGLHVNDGVLFAGQTLDGLNGNRLGQGSRSFSRVLQARRLRPLMRIASGAADAVCTGSAEGDGAVYFPT